MKFKHSILNKKRILFTALLIMGCIYGGSAQIINPDPVDDEAPAAPIDGFLGIGLLIGAAYGVNRKLKQERK